MNGRPPGSPGTPASDPPPATSPDSPRHSVLGTRHSLGLIVVAAGRGERMGFDKLWAPLGDRPLIAHPLAALAAPPVEHLALVVTAGRLAAGRALAASLAVPS